MTAGTEALPAGSTPPRLPRPVPAPVVASPRIRALAAQPASALAVAVEGLWAEAVSVGTPLLEPVEEPGECIATFLWRGDAARVLLLANKLADRSNLARSLMERVPGTDLWHLSYRLPAEWRGSYVFAVDRDGADVPFGRLASGVLAPDPVNSRILLQAPGVGARSVAELPAAPPQRFLAARPGVRRGLLQAFEVESVALGGRRRVRAYTPAGYDEGTDAYPLLVLLDGEMWADRLCIQPTLDNLVAEGAIPPLVAVLVESGDRSTRFRELACSNSFASFLASEIVPWAAGRWNVTADPARTVVAGQSLGGLAAAHAALAAPDRFGAVLAQSGSWWWPSDPPEEAEAFTRRIAAFPTAPVRFYLETGTDEWVSLEPARRLRDALRRRGYDVTYREFAGGHDQACWRGGLADGLVALLGPRVE